MNLTRPWEWRKASGGWGYDGLFHACDVNHNLACSPGSGLQASCERHRLS